VNDEAGLRAAVNDSSVTAASEVVVTANVLLTAGHLWMPPGRNLTLRGRDRLIVLATSYYTTPTFAHWLNCII
jgi:hypothetical protein